MRISTRHLISARLLAAPGSRSARSSSPAPPLRAASRSRAARSAGPGDGEAEAAQEGCAPHPARGHQAGAEAAPNEEAPPRRPRKPIGSATLEGSKPTTPQAPVGAPPAGRRSRPDLGDPRAGARVARVRCRRRSVPTVDPTLAQVAQATQQQAGNDEASIRVIVYGAGRAGRARLACARPTSPSLSLISAFAATIKASTLGQLGLATGVTRVVVDSPVKATDSGHLDDRRHEGRHPVPADERRDRRLGPGPLRPGHRRRRARQRRHAEPVRPRQPRRPGQARAASRAGRT